MVADLFRPWLVPEFVGHALHVLGQRRRVEHHRRRLLRGHLVGEGDELVFRHGAHLGVNLVNVRRAEPGSQSTGGAVILVHQQQQLEQSIVVRDTKPGHLPPGAQRVVEAMFKMARHTITATSVGLVPLDREQRIALLSGIDTTEVLVALTEMQADLDTAMLNSAPTLPLEAMRIVDSQWYEPVRQQLAAGHRLPPPQTMVRLMREIIEADEGAATFDCTRATKPSSARQPPPTRGHCRHPARPQRARPSTTPGGADDD